MQQVADRYQQEGSAVTAQNLRNELRIEGGKDLVQHQSGTLHRVGAEDEPAEADEVEGKQNAHEAHHGVHILAQHLCTGYYGQPHLMQGQGYTVQSTPQDKAHGCSVP